jgi:hypothetical protein
VTFCDQLGQGTLRFENPLEECRFLIIQRKTSELSQSRENSISALSVGLMPPRTHLVVVRGTERKGKYLHLSLSLLDLSPCCLLIPPDSEGMANHEG